MHGRQFPRFLIPGKAKGPRGICHAPRQIGSRLQAPAYEWCMLLGPSRWRCLLLGLYISVERLRVKSMKFKYVVNIPKVFQVENCIREAPLFE